MAHQLNKVGIFNGGSGFNANKRPRGWIRERLARHNPETWARMRISTAIFFCILAALVVLTFFLYMSRISAVKNDSSTQNVVNQPAFGQLNLELPPPLQISVTINRGATIKWQGEADSRVLGYNVYRYTGEGDKGSKINASIISDAVYFDDEGTMFNSYAVAMVDTNGRQGILSAPVIATAEPSSLASLTPTQEPEQIEDFTFEDNHPQPGLQENMVGCASKGMTYVGVWYLEHYAEVTGGELMATPYYSASCTYTFVGDGVSVIATRHWNYGIMNVYIDSQLLQEIDLYSAQAMVKDRVFTVSGLGQGVHTIKLECTGRKNPEANFAFINIEGLEIKR